MASRRRVQSVRAGEGGGPGKTFRHLGDQGDAAVRRGGAQERPHAHGGGLRSYGVEQNRKVLDYFLGQHHAQGLSSRRVSVDELFHPGTYEAFKL